ncbi:MAG TPA: GH25 family lysozyme, partial [Mycobacteriales bacterium]|nr:GH25 family lysozyme [Mycobacteriales bacterium]
SPDALTADGTRRANAACSTLTTRLSPAVSTANVPGIDVSNWQYKDKPAVDWSDVGTTSNKFVISKATEIFANSDGSIGYYLDPTLQTTVAGARANGMYAGAYAFVNPGVLTPQAQADYFANAYNSLGGPLLPPVLDLENSGGLTPTELVAWAHAFLDELQTKTGRTPMIYSGPCFWAQSMDNDTSFTSYPLWVAHYDSAPPAAPLTQPLAFGGWEHWTLWQYTSKGTTTGITGNVDQDRAVDTTTLQSLVRSFADVPATGPNANPFSASIDRLSQAGVIEGYPDGTFRPGLDVSRQAFAAFLARILDLTGDTSCAPGQSTFPDVPDDSPFCAAIGALVTSGVIEGYDDGGFHPGAPISRQAIAAFLQRTDVLLAAGDAAGAGAGTGAGGESTGGGAGGTGTATGTVTGSVVGDSGTGDIEPTCPTPRPFNDITEQFCGAIAFLADNGITEGYPDGGFHPTAPTTRQATAAFLDRFTTLEGLEL